MSGGGAETADVVVVGGRCAGAATATALARAGRRVVVLERGRFGADTLSTHLLFPGAVVELRNLGALDRVLALGAPRLPVASVGAHGLEAAGPYTPMDGIDYALCVRRPGLDAALIATAREAGADARDRRRVTHLLRDGDGGRGRVTGVRFTDRDGTTGEIRAPLVVGADGRSSTVARLVGATIPRRSNPNERACWFAYFEDVRDDRRAVASQWRHGAELGTAFPCDGGLVLVLLMPPVTRSEAFRADREGEYLRTVDAIPGLRERLRGCTLASKVRGTNETTSYFLPSAGPGWALPGDSGHFKDPVTAQGIRDALRFGRLLGELTAGALHHPAALDAVLDAWERRRERECLEVFRWTNALGRAEALTPLEDELYRELVRSPQLVTRLLDVLARSRRPRQVQTARLGLRLTAKALARRGADRRAVLRCAARELQDRRA